MPVENTYFEQIAVETVKKITRDIPQTNAIENSHEMVIEREDRIDARDQWRALAHRIQGESDANKMIALVQQLIVTFDREQRGASLGLTTNCRSLQRCGNTISTLPRGA